MKKPRIDDSDLDAALAAAFGEGEPEPIPKAAQVGPSGSATSDSAIAVPRPEGQAHAEIWCAGEDSASFQSRYDVIEQIAEGGMGEILLVRDKRLKRKLTVKALREEFRGRPEAAQRFAEEAQIAAQLQHPSIVPVHDVGQFDEGRPFFAMKLVRGRTLAELLDECEDPKQDRPRLLGIFEQVCQALAYAHSRKVIHRDLTPANVMVGRFGEVQVMDWGLAKVLASDDDDTQPTEIELKKQRDSAVLTDRIELADTEGDGLTTHVGTVFGTPAYMSPEQASGDVDTLDKRTDVFGLGAILCKLLTGDPPYVGEDGTTVRQLAQDAELDDAFARLDACGADAELVDLAKRCLAARPADRPQDAGCVAAEMAAYLESVSKRLRQAELQQVRAIAKAEEERKRRVVTLLLSAVALLLVIVGGGGWAWIRGQRLEYAAKLDRQRAAAAVRERDLAQQRVRLLREVDHAMAEAMRLRGQAEMAPIYESLPWARAHQAATRAVSLLEAVSTDPDRIARARKLAAELVAAEKDSRMVCRLEDAQMRQVELDGQGGRFLAEAFSPAVDAALSDYGLAVGETPVDEAVWRIAGRPEPVRNRLIVALDGRALRGSAEAPEQPWLQAVLDQADGDPFRRRVRQATRREDRAELLQLATSAEVLQQPPRGILLLGESLNRWGEVDSAIELLRRARQRYPDDFWLNQRLGDILTQGDSPEGATKAIRYYSFAMASRQNPGTYLNMAVRLEQYEWYDAALLALQAAIRLRPDLASARLLAANLLRKHGQSDEAIDMLRTGVELAPGNTRLLACVVQFLNDSGRWEESLQYSRAAIQQDSNCESAYLHLTTALCALGRWDAALGVCDQAVEAMPDRGSSYRDKMEETRKQREQGSRLAAVLSGQRKPSDADERIELAQTCSARQRRFAAATQFYQEAFEETSNGADEEDRNRMPHLVHVEAARAAALAGTGQGAEADSHDPDQRAAFRRQALRWLRAELDDMVSRLLRRPVSAASREECAAVLRGWEYDPAFALIREDAMLQHLPSEEQRELREFWTKVKRHRRIATHPAAWLLDAADAGDESALSRDASATPAVGELLPNGGFESGILNPWFGIKADVIRSDAYEGQYVVRLGDGRSKSNGVVRIVEGLTPNTTYRVSVWVKSANEGDVWLYVTDYGGERVEQYRYAMPNYRDVTATFRTGPDNTSARLTLYAEPYVWSYPNAVVYADAFRLTPEQTP